MKAWNVSVDIAFGAPRERASMEDALEDLLPALMEDFEIEGPVIGLNALKIQSPSPRQTPAKNRGS